MDWSQQVQVYVSWVNSQLRKCPSVPAIGELRDPSVCDGTVLSHLIELISGQTVPDILSRPMTVDERIANIEKILNFMQLHKVKMHAIEAQAVVDGDLKSIMRIVLALAAHFKPRSVRPNHSVAAIMQGAAVSLANTKHQVLRSPSITEKRFDFAMRSPSLDSAKPSTNGHQSKVSDPRMNQKAFRRPSVGLVKALHRGANKRGYRSRLSACRDGDEDTEGSDRGYSKAIPLTPRARSLVSTPSVDTPSANEADSGCHVTPCSVSVPLGSSKVVGLGDSQDGQFPEITEELLSELGETRGLLEQLQQMLLSRTPSGDGVSSDGFPDANFPLSDDGSPKRQVAEDRVRSLEEDLRQRDDRLFTNEFRLRQAIMRTDTAQEEAAELRSRLAEKENAMAVQQQQLERLQHHVATLSRDLESAVEERCRLSRDLARSSDERERVSRSLHDRIIELECRVMRPGLVTNNTTAAAELEHRAIVFGECVERLRSSLAANDPLHHTLDQLEHCFHYQATAVASVSAVPPAPPPRSTFTPVQRTANRPSSLELARDVKRQPITALQGFPVQRLDMTMEEDERSTRLLYYTDKTITPFMVTIPKRLKEVRLADVRRATAQHSRPSSGTPRLRFLFKTHDSEFGTAVKEEVRHDDDLVPVWEDKIIAWITDIPETVPPHG